MDSETTLYSAIAAIFMASVAWLGRFFVGRTIKRIDDVEVTVNHVREHCIKIETLAETESRLLASIHSNSEHIKTQLEHLYTRIERSNDRIDRLRDGGDHNV